MPNIKVINKPNFTGQLIHSAEFTASQQAINNYLLGLNSDESVRTQLSKLKRFCSAFETSVEAFDFTQLEKMTVLSVLNFLKSEGMKASTLNAMLAAVKGVVSELQDLNLMNFRTAETILKVKRFKASLPDVGRALTKPEIQEILHNEIKPGPAGTRDKAICALLLGCGLRRTELVRINRGHIDFEAGSVKILGKGNKKRTIYIPNKALSVVKDFVNNVFIGQSDSPLFTRIRKGDDITYERLSTQAIYVIVKRLGIPEIAPHDFRRTYITALFEAKQDVSVIQQLAGHASPSTTVMYDKRGEKAKRSAVSSLNF